MEELWFAFGLIIGVIGYALVARDRRSRRWRAAAAEKAEPFVERCTECKRPLVHRPDVGGLECVPCDRLWSAAFPPSYLATLPMPRGLDGEGPR